VSESTNISSDSEIDRRIRGRSFCLETELSVEKVWELESRPNESSNRCLSSKLDNNKGIYLSPILFNREMSCQSKEGEIHNNPVWQTQSWYSTLLQILIQGPIKLPTFPELILSPQGKVHPLTKNNNLTLGFGKYQGR
jgi:hypothetical protein